MAGPMGFDYSHAGGRGRPSPSGRSQPPPSGRKRSVGDPVIGGESSLSTAGFKVVSVLVAAVFGFGGVVILLSDVREQADITFAALFVAAPLFTVFLLGFLCFWFARLTEDTNSAIWNTNSAIEDTKRALNETKRVIGGLDKEVREMAEDQTLQEISLTLHRIAEALQSGNESSDEG